MPVKIAQILFTLICLALSGPLQARGNSNSSLAGTWSLDLSQMPVPPDARPLSVTLTFAGIDKKRWRMTVVIIGNNNSKRVMASEYRLDGVAVSIKGDQLEADMAAVRMPTPGIMVLGLANSGRPASTRVYVVAPDGASMTEHAVTYGDTGVPTIRINRFVRASVPMGKG